VILYHTNTYMRYLTSSRHTVAELKCLRCKKPCKETSRGERSRAQRDQSSAQSTPPRFTSSPVAVFLELAARRSQPWRALPAPAELTMNIAVDVCARFVRRDLILGPVAGRRQLTEWYR
jgi:hypothetical protein